MPDTPKTDEVVKDLDYFLQHPDEMPTDPLTLEKLFEASADPTKAVDGDDKPNKDAAPAGDTTPTDKPAGDEVKPDGVLAKDGKHIIPYAEMERRLQEVRESADAQAAARTEAEAYAKQLEQQLRDASEKIAAAAKGDAPTGDQPLTADLPTELMETLESEFPTIAQAVKAQQAALARAIGVLNAMEQRMGTAEQHRVEDEAAEVQGLIQQVPQLQTWQQKAPYLFKRAQEVEGAILNDKEFMAKHPDLKTDDVSRYREVVNRVRGEIGLPPVDWSASPSKEKTEQEKADEIVAGAATAIPRSLSDMPAGKAAVPASDTLDELSAVEIGQRFMGMTPEQIQAQLARL